MGLCVSKLCAPDHTPLNGGRAERNTRIANSHKAWTDIVSNIRNPDGDGRIDSLINRIGMIYAASKTLRERMNQIDQQGGVVLRIVPDSDIGQSFGHAETRLGSREAVLAESTARDEKGSNYRPLSIMLVELTNMSRIKEFQQVNSRFLQGYSGIERAAHDTEKVEYQTTQDMNRYYREARSIIQNLDYGSPNLWYSHDNGEMVYPTFEHYFRTMSESGHTDAYRNFFSMAEQYRLTRNNENAG